MATNSSFDTQPPPTAFSDPGDGSDGGGMTRGANYFFGFLITFVVLLLIFVGCGIGSRRRFLARRQALLAGTLDPWAPITPGGEYRKPILHEKVISFSDDDWSSIQPLSLQAVRASPSETDHKADGDDASNSRSSSSFSDRRSSRRVSDIFPSLAFLRRLSTSTGSSTVNDEEKQVVVEMPETVQVAVMVMMPSPPADRRLSAHRFNDDGTDKLPEYQLGVARIPWFSEFPPVQRQQIPPPPSFA